MFQIDVAEALRNEGHDVVRIRLKVNPTTSKDIIKLILPFLRLYNTEQFMNYLVILSQERSKWIRTA